LSQHFSKTSEKWNYSYKDRVSLNWRITVHHRRRNRSGRPGGCQTNNFFDKNF